MDAEKQSMDAEETQAEAVKAEMNAAGLEGTRIVVPAGGFEFITPDGQTLLRIQHAPSGEAALTLFGPNGLPAVFLNTTYYGGDLGVCRNDGNPLIRAAAHEDEGAFCVFGKENEPTFAVPAVKMAASRGKTS